MMKTYLISCLLVCVFFSGAGCKKKVTTVHIADASKPTTLSLGSATDDVASGLTVTVTGSLQGSGTIAVGQSSLAVSGEVNETVYQDIFTASCDLQYTPDDGCTGSLQIDYTFH